jgi:hypothetical protein
MLASSAGVAIVLLVVLRFVGASRIPNLVRYFFAPAIGFAVHISGSYDQPNEPALIAGMFLETFLAVMIVRGGASRVSRLLGPRARQ